MAENTLGIDGIKPILDVMEQLDNIISLNLSGDYYVVTIEDKRILLSTLSYFLRKEELLIKNCFQTGTGLKEKDAEGFRGIFEVGMIIVASLVFIVCYLTSILIN